ncbi:MAG: DUF4168 domain-containing protein [Gammaproteobacteria bacterium]|nr:MAG: DUF4168 domain-containing protein [Gammaproteobacteria bacterium]
METQVNLKQLAALAAAGVLITASHFAMAQQGGYGAGQQGGGYQPEAQQPAQPAQPEQPAQPSFDDETLERFAGAWNNVQEIRDEYMGEIQAAGDAEQAQALQQEAQEKMVEAVTEAGVEVSEYNEIATRMGQDPEFAQMVMSMAQNR